MSIPFGVHIPFVANLGFSLEKFEDGTSELHYSPRPEHHNSFDIKKWDLKKLIRTDLNYYTLEFKHYDFSKVSTQIYEFNEWLN